MVSHEEKHRRIALGDSKGTREAGIASVCSMLVPTSRVDLLLLREERILLAGLKCILFCLAVHRSYGSTRGGKTTLGKLAVELLKCQKGEVLVGGHPMSILTLGSIGKKWGIDFKNPLARSLVPPFMGISPLYFDSKVSQKISLRSLRVKIALRIFLVEEKNKV